MNRSILFLLLTMWCSAAESRQRGEDSLRMESGYRVQSMFGSFPGSDPRLIAKPDTLVLPSLVRLRPPGSTVIEDWQVPAVSQGSLRWETAAAGGGMILSGVLAAYLKDRANFEFSNYNMTLDPRALHASRRLDNQSAIVFAVTQLSFVLLTYLLLSE